MKDSVKYNCLYYLSNHKLLYELFDYPRLLLIFDYFNKNIAINIHIELER